MRRLDGEGDRETTEQDISKLVMRLELLPIEVCEVILSCLRPADLVAVAASSPQLEVALRCPRLWRRWSVQLSGNDVRFALRQIELAPELKELKFGYGKLSLEAVNAISSYEGPIPYVHTLRLSLSILGTQLGVFLLTKHGQKARKLELDLRHGPLEPPRNNIAVIKLLPNLCCLESLIVRSDDINDIVVLSQQALKLVEIDIHRLRVGDIVRGGPGPAVGATAAHLISRHICHLQTLRLPMNFDANLTAVVVNCRELRSLACNVWTLPAIETHSHLHSLLVFPPDCYTTSHHFYVLLSHARRSRNVLTRLKELRFVRSDVNCDVLLPLASTELAQAVMCLLLAICRSLEVIEVQWKIIQNVQGSLNWLDIVLSNGSSNLRELWLRGNSLSPRYILSLAKYCSNLQILDLRRSENASDDTSKSKAADVTTKGRVGVRRVLTLLQESLPKLTILFDDSGENFYDWNFYLNPEVEKSGSTQTCAHLPSFEASKNITKEKLERLFRHLLTLDQWVSAENFVIPSREAIHIWQCATLDSSLWSSVHFAELLSFVPALGLIDCRNQKSLPPGKKGHSWIRALARGPTRIRALRIRAVLVSSNLWGLITPILQRIKESLCCLELDFRGRPFRNWRDVLSALGELPNLAEFVLRGSFIGDKPVLDWLHGQLRSLKRLDLRDCLMMAKQMPAFVESLQKLLLELRETLRAVALPPLPLSIASRVLRTLGELTDLREVALHANELESLRPLKSLCVLELYGDRPPRNKILPDRVARSFRDIGDTLRGVESLTLPAKLVESNLVQEAIIDVMPNLRKLIVIYEDSRKLRLCAVGPRCRDLMSKFI